MEKNKPIKKIRSGGIQASIFKNTIKKEKDTFEFLTIALQRSYKKSDSDEWINETINLRKSDMPKILVVLNAINNELFLNKEDLEEHENKTI